MSRSHVRSASHLIVATIISFSLSFTMVALRSTATPQRAIIPGHLVPALHGLRPVSLLSSHQQLHLSIGLTLLHRAALDALIARQDDQQSGVFHHYITPQPFTASVGPAPATTAAVVAYLREQGLHIDSVSSADLDMEVAHAMAPGAAERVYLGPNSGGLTLTGADPYLSDINQVYNQIVSDNQASIVSMSWGAGPGCEAGIDITGSGATSAELSQMDTILAQGASQGIAFFVASGDFGAQDCAGLYGNPLSVDITAADPHVVAVGGTNLTRAVGGRLEGGWMDSGGGKSTYFQAPYYQSRYPDIANVVGNQRGVPDVSAEAYYDSSHGYATYCSFYVDMNNSCSGWSTGGGTSAATPLWAGIAADINQYLNAQGKATLGTASALLYQAYESEYMPLVAFNDIADGTSNGGYTAGIGYDLVTGLGSPDAWGLAGDLFNIDQTNIESDAIWGQTQNNTCSNNARTNDLMVSYYQSSTRGYGQPVGWSAPVDVSQMVSNSNHGNQESPCLSLVPNVGQPAEVSYPTYGEGTEVDVFALATENNTSSQILHGFSYLPASGSWTDLGAIGSQGALQPLHNPVAVVVNANDPTNPNQPTNPTAAVFGIASNGHLIEYYLTNSVREYSGNPTGFNYRDISNAVGIGGCDPAISPAAVIYNSVPVVFARCNGILVEFYDNTQGNWNANAGIVGNHIPNASESFPHHSITAMVVPGSPATLEAYVASDQNSVSALSEYEYAGSGWHNFTLPIGITPDQLYAKTVVIAEQNGPTPISELVVVGPANTTCALLPSAVQYLYQPQLPNPAWHQTTLPDPGITTMQAIVEQSGQVETEALTGAYFQPGGIGSNNGSGCTGSSAGYIHEDGSTLSSATTQSWWSALVNSSRPDNVGMEPTNTEFPY